LTETISFIINDFRLRKEDYGRPFLFYLAGYSVRKFSIPSQAHKKTDLIVEILIRYAIICMYDNAYVKLHVIVYV